MRSIHPRGESDHLRVRMEPNAIEPDSEPRAGQIALGVGWARFRTLSFRYFEVVSPDAGSRVYNSDTHSEAAHE